MTDGIVTDRRYDVITRNDRRLTRRRFGTREFIDGRAMIV